MPITRISLGNHPPPITKGLTMWLLVTMLLAAPTGISRITVLNTFATSEDCKPERDRIGFEMAESYPQENSFQIVCELREQTPSAQPIRFEREAPHPVTVISNTLGTLSPQFSPTHRID